jgi:outer membrane immunogenic protein
LAKATMGVWRRRRHRRRPYCRKSDEFCNSSTRIGHYNKPLPPSLTLLGSPTATASEKTEINWLSTIRGRVGFTVQDRLLLFATGGLAIAEAHSEGSVTVTSSSAQTIWSGSHSVVKAGFAVGGGGEWAFANRWTAKAEYLWYDLGNVSHPLACTSGFVSGFSCTSTPGLFATLGNAVSSLRGSILRFGINYRFN